MRALQSFTSLDDVARSYGGNERHMPVGILIDHVGALSHLGATRVVGESVWFVPHAGGRAYPVLCGDIIEYRHEDGISDGRCGHRVVAGGTGCQGHDLGPDHLKECEHGLSLALCAGPSHYPMDM
jgi:hypothetical protein